MTQELVGGTRTFTSRPVPPRKGDDPGFTRYMGANFPMAPLPSNTGHRVTAADEIEWLQRRYPVAAGWTADQQLRAEGMR